MIGGWTVDTLREHFIMLMKEADERYEQRFVGSKTALDIAFNAQKELVTSALASADKAVIKAEVAAEKRFDAVNEFRALVSDQQRTLMPRLEAEIVFRSLAEKIDSLQASMNVSKGKDTGSHEGTAFVLSIIGVFISIIAVLVMIFRI